MFVTRLFYLHCIIYKLNVVFGLTVITVNVRDKVVLPALHNLQIKCGIWPYSNHSEVPT
jgi:hypothetical protein